MMRYIWLIGLMVISVMAFGQDHPLQKLNFLIGDWSGNGIGFGNEKSTIEASFHFALKDQFIEVQHQSTVEPTEPGEKPETHVDKGMISYAKNRKTIIFRQYHGEGYMNQYVLNDSLSTDSIFVFETELIENFVPGGQARWTIKRITKDEIETTFNVSFPEQDYVCFGTNRLLKK